MFLCDPASSVCASFIEILYNVKPTGTQEP